MGEQQMSKPWLRDNPKSSLQINRDIFLTVVSVLLSVLFGICGIYYGYSSSKDARVLQGKLDSVESKLAQAEKDRNQLAKQLLSIGKQLAEHGQQWTQLIAMIQGLQSIAEKGEGQYQQAVREIVAKDHALSEEIRTMSNAIYQSLKAIKGLDKKIIDDYNLIQTAPQSSFTPQSFRDFIEIPKQQIETTPPSIDVDSDSDNQSKTTHHITPSSPVNRTQTQPSNTGDMLNNDQDTLPAPSFMRTDFL